MYYNTKGSIQSATNCLCASCAQNDALEAALNIEMFKAQSEEILMHNVLYLCDSLLQFKISVTVCS